MSDVFEAMLDPDPSKMSDLLYSLHPCLRSLPSHEVTAIAVTSMRFVLSTVADALRAPSAEQQRWLVEYTGR